MLVLDLPPGPGPSPILLLICMEFQAPLMRLMARPLSSARLGLRPEDEEPFPGVVRGGNGGGGGVATGGELGDNGGGGSGN